MEQSTVSSNLAASRAALALNNMIRTKNLDLESARDGLQNEEDELVSMYSKWLDEDNEEIDLTEAELKVRGRKRRCERGGADTPGCRAAGAPSSAQGDVRRSQDALRLTDGKVKGTG